MAGRRHQEAVGEILSRSKWMVKNRTEAGKFNRVRLGDNWMLGGESWHGQGSIFKWEQGFLHTGTGKTSLRGKQSSQDGDNRMVVKKLTWEGDGQAGTPGLSKTRAQLALSAISKYFTPSVKAGITHSWMLSSSIQLELTVSLGCLPQKALFTHTILY